MSGRYMHYATTRKFDYGYAAWSFGWASSHGLALPVGRHLSGLVGAADEATGKFRPLSVPSVDRAVAPSHGLRPRASAAGHREATRCA